jgi:hypothetical protein
VTALPYRHPSDEATWEGLEKVWTGIQQFAPRKAKPVSSWWLVLIGFAIVGLALRAGL